MKKFIILTIIFLILIIGIVFYLSQKTEDLDFSVDAILIKQNIFVGGESSSFVKIKNLDKTEQSFKFYFENMGEIAYVDEKEIVMGSNELKEIKINFKDNKNLTNIYTGYFVVESSKSTKKIPVILTIKEVNRLFAITQNVIPRYEEVYPGGEFGMSIKIFNLEDNEPKKIKASYFVKDFYSKEIFVSEEELVIKGSFETTKIIEIPQNVSEGQYIFITILIEEGVRSDASSIFRVISQKREIFSGGLKYFVMLVIVFIIGVVSLFYYFVKSRDNMLIKYRRQRNTELKRSLAVIKESKSGIKNLSDTSRREKEIKELDKIKEKILSYFENKKERQESELKKLQQKGKKEEIEKKVSLWSKEERSEIIKSELIRQRLQIQLGLLKNAYDEGHITKKSYMKGRKKIEAVINKLKNKIYK